MAPFSTDCRITACSNQVVVYDLGKESSNKPLYSYAPKGSSSIVDSSWSKDGSCLASCVNNSDKVIAFHRWSQGGPGDDVIVLLNFRDKAWSDYRIGLPRAGTWKVRFNSDWDGYDAGFSNHPSNDVNTDDIAWDGMAQSASLSFGPYTAIILSQ